MEVSNKNTWLGKGGFYLSCLAACLIIGVSVRGIEHQWVVYRVTTMRIAVMWGCFVMAWGVFFSLRYTLRSVTRRLTTLFLLVRILMHLVVAISFSLVLPLLELHTGNFNPYDQEFWAFWGGMAMFLLHVGASAINESIP